MVDGKTTVRGIRRDTGAPPRWQLRVTEGASTGTVVRLEPREYIIGKDEAADVRLTDSGVSRQHAKIVFSSDGLAMIVDLDSTNGTLVNDARVELSRLHPGSRVCIGPDAAFVFEAETDAPIAADSPASLGLTPRELEVARRVAAGRTNVEIAAELKITRRTVATHLENIYRRLEIGSRAELARKLAEAGEA